jgi:hypothetical protein
MFHGLTPAADDPLAFEYEADIAYSAQAFRYYLKGATGVAQYEDYGNVLKGTYGATSWTITLGPERFEGIALLKMSRMQMKLRLEGYSREAADTFLTRFLHHYQRGGG